MRDKKMCVIPFDPLPLRKSEISAGHIESSLKKLFLSSMFAGSNI
jgi:hypothetical protein